MPIIVSKNTYITMIAIMLMIVFFYSNLSFTVMYK